MCSKRECRAYFTRELSSPGPSRGESILAPPRLSESSMIGVERSAQTCGCRLRGVKTGHTLSGLGGGAVIPGSFLRTAS